MIQSKLSLHEGVVAEPHEIQELNNYRDSRLPQKSFLKPFSDLGYKSLFSTTPYRFLRSQWSWAIGLRAVEILDEAWKNHELTLSETRPSKLKPCLLRAFLLVTQLTPDPQVQDKIRKSLRAFEGNFFTLLSDTAVNEDCRFVLLGQLRKGLADGLFFELQSDDGKNPSHNFGQAPEIALTQLEFGHACRHKNWVLACQKWQVLKTRTPSVPVKDLVRIYEGLEREGRELQYQTTMLKELTFRSDLDLKKRKAYAMKAWSQVAGRVAGGELERVILELFASKQPIWSEAFHRLYKSIPVAHRWWRDFYWVGQKSSVMRRKCRVLVDLLRCSKQRARHGLRQKAEQNIQLRTQALNRLDEIGSKTEGVARSFESPPSYTPRSNQLRLSSSVEQALDNISGALSVGERVSVKFSPEVCWVESVTEAGHLSVVVGSQFLQSDEPEQIFLLARTLYRQSSGLDRLEARNGNLTSAKMVLQRALNFADWNCYRSDVLLAESRESNPSRKSATLVLQATYDKTGDDYFGFLLECLCIGGWCPSEEAEADRFACSYSDVVSASHALVKIALGRNNNIGQLCLEDGLGSLVNSGKLLPVLCLRLQRLWCSFLEL